MNRLVVAGSIALVCAPGLCGCKPSADVAAPDPGAEPAGISVVVEAPTAAATACEARTARGALALIPDASDWIVHIAPREVMGSLAWSILAPVLATDQDWMSAQQVFTNCGLSLSELDHVLIGFEPDGEFVVTVAAPTIGRPEVAQCLILEIQGLAGDEQIAEVIEWAEDPSVQIVEFTDGRAYLFAEDLLTLATSNWQAEVGRLGRCEGVAAIDGLGRALLERVEHNAPLWLTGRLSSGTELGIEESFGVERGSVREFAVSMRLDDGASLLAQAQMQDAQSALSLTKGIAGVSMMLASAAPPVLAKVLERANTDRLDTLVIFEMSASADELRALAVH